MGFHEDATFPENISFGSRGGPGYNTNIIEMDGGQVQTVPRWSETRHTFNAAYGVKSPADIFALKQFYIARLGVANGFRYKDWVDFTTNPTNGADVTVAATDQEAVRVDDTTFQMTKQYTQGSVTRNRKITKPRAGTIVAVDGITVSTGFSLNVATGIITFTDPIAGDSIVTWGGQFDVPVMFGKELDGNFVLTMDDFGVRSAEDITLVELVDPGPSTDEYFYGGATSLCLSANYTLSVAQSRLYVVTFSAGGLALILPDATDVPPGGAIFEIINAGATNSGAVKTSGGTTLATVAAAHGCQILLGVDVDGNPIWYAQ